MLSLILAVVLETYYVNTLAHVADKLTIKSISIVTDIVYDYKPVGLDLCIATQRYTRCLSLN